MTKEPKETYNTATLLSAMALMHVMANPETPPVAQKAKASGKKKKKTPQELHEYNETERQAHEAAKSKKELKRIAEREARQPPLTAEEKAAKQERDRAESTRASMETEERQQKKAQQDAIVRELAQNERERQARLTKEREARQKKEKETIRFQKEGPDHKQKFQPALDAIRARGEATALGEALLEATKARDLERAAKDAKEQIAKQTIERAVAKLKRASSPAAKQERDRAESTRASMEAEEKQQKQAQQDAIVKEPAQNERERQAPLTKEREARQKNEKETKALREALLEEIKARGLERAAKVAKEQIAKQTIKRAVAKLKRASSPEVREARRMRLEGDTTKSEAMTEAALRDCILAIVNATNFTKLEKEIKQYKIIFSEIFGKDVEKYLDIPTKREDEPSKADKIKYINFVSGAAGLIKRCGLDNLNKNKITELSSSNNKTIEQAFDDAQLPFLEKLKVEAKLFIRATIRLISFGTVNVFKEAAKYHEDRTNGEIFLAAMSAMDSIEAAPHRVVQSRNVSPDANNRHHHQSMNASSIQRV